MNSRLEQFLAAENISQSQFADTIDVARASVSHILAGRNKPGWDFLNSMLKHYPNLNIEWLLNGTGKMYKNMRDEPRSSSRPEELPADLFTPPSVPVEPAAADAGTPAALPQIPPESQIRREDVHPYMNTSRTESQDFPAVPVQSVENQRKISKIVVFYDDNTFTEIR